MKHDQAPGSVNADNGMDDLVISFTTYGLWMFMNGTTYVQLHGLNPEAIVTGRFDVF